jgi:Domain of unknown function (DUF4385)
MQFDYSLDYDTIDFRKQPHLYRIGKGEQGVLLVQPYKSELLPLWRFKTPEIAKQSASALYQKFVEYKSKGDFVGMDMARKFVQMGYTRSRRYANHKTGRKWSEGRVTVLPLEEDSQKAQSAKHFQRVLKRINADAFYKQLKQRHLSNFLPA